MGVAAVDLVMERLGIEAKRIGSRWWAERCPLPNHGGHNAKHAWQNFFVRANGIPQAGLWHCYSCGGGGRLTNLVQAVRGCTWVEAREWLRELETAAAPEPVVRVRYEPAASRRSFHLPEGCEFPPPWSEWNSVARDYAIGRGLTPEQVRRWGIGYALMGRLEGRLVVPIVDREGRLANYAARTFIDDPTRYLAAGARERPDTSVMLGERFWPRSLVDRKRGAVLTFEGALSGLALERAMLRAGVSGVHLAGLQGVNLEDPRRGLRLASFGRIVCGFDPDAAGDRAARDVERAAGGTPVARFRYPRRGADAADTPEAELAELLRECFGPAA